MGDAKEGPGTYFFILTGKVYEGEWVQGVPKVRPGLDHMAHMSHGTHVTWHTCHMTHMSHDTRVT
jgi:hypothetical protein